jgi:hypothetical protein
MTNGLSFNIKQRDQTGSAGNFDRAKGGIGGQRTGALAGEACARQAAHIRQRGDKGSVGSAR